MEMRDPRVEVENSLGSFHLPESQLATFLTTCGAMRLFTQVGAPGGPNHLGVIDLLQNRTFADGRSVPRQLIRADCVRNVIFAQQSLEERPCCVCRSVALEEHGEHGSVFVNRSPKPVGHPTHDHVHFIQVPSGTPAGFPMAYVLGNLTAELDAPGADRLAGDAKTALEQQFLDILSLRAYRWESQTA